MQKGLSPILTIFLIALGIGGYLIYSGKISTKPEQLFCTMDAKICPDGTGVGRIPPKCEFAPCPSGNNETANWKTYTSNKYSFSIKYPANLEANDQSASPPSVLFEPPATQPGAPGFPTFWVSVEPIPSSRNTYNSFSQEDLDTLYNSKVGEVISTAKNLKPPYSDYWNFKHVSDTEINNVGAMVVENNKVWEGGSSLVERIVFIKNNNKTYMIGTYYNNQTDLQAFQLFLSTFKFTQ